MLFASILKLEMLENYLQQTFSDKFFAGTLRVNKTCIFLLVEKMKLLHFTATFYLLAKTWKYGGSVFGTGIAGGAQKE